jgi:hypothetical protein
MQKLFVPVHSIMLAPGFRRGPGFARERRSLDSSIETLLPGLCSVLTISCLCRAAESVVDVLWGLV